MNKDEIKHVLQGLYSHTVQNNSRVTEKDIDQLYQHNDTNMLVAIFNEIVEKDEYSYFNNFQFPLFYNENKGLKLETELLKRFLVGNRLNISYPNFDRLVEKYNYKGENNSKNLLEILARELYEDITTEKLKFNLVIIYNILKLEHNIKPANHLKQMLELFEDKNISDPKALRDSLFQISEKAKLSSNLFRRKRTLNIYATLFNANPSSREKTDDLEMREFNSQKKYNPQNTPNLNSN